MTVPVGISIAQVGHAMVSWAPADVVLAFNPALGLATLVGLMVLCMAAMAASKLGACWRGASRWLRRRLGHRMHGAVKQGWHAV